MPRLLLFIAAAGVFASGCADAPSPASDAGVMPDLSVVDAPSPGADVTDVPAVQEDQADVVAADTPVEAAVDAPGSTNPCDPSAVVDLNIAARREGATLVYEGTTTRGAATQTWAPPADCVPAGRVIRTVVHRVRTSAAAALRVIAEGPASPVHDIVFYAHNACTPASPPRFCLVSTVRTAQVSETITRIPAGTIVWLAVSTVAKGDGEPGAPYTLRVTELPGVELGGACDNFDLQCGPGSGCVFAEGESIGVCAADGSTNGARCRTGAPQCDSGLSCGSSICRRTLPDGARCTTNLSVCASGSRCAMFDPRWTEGRCIGGGVTGGPCSPSVPCGDGSSCSSSTGSGFCQRFAEPGEACAVNLGVLCRDGESCVLVGDPSLNTYRCAAYGTAAGARCADDVPRCNAGLRCTSETGQGWCRAAATDACNPRIASDCGDGRICAITAPNAGRCTAWTRESSGDNNGVATAEAPRRPPFAVRGALLTAGDTDCFTIEMTAPGRLVYQVQDGTNICVVGTAQTTFTTPDRQRISVAVDGCGLSAATNNALRRPAGRYVVCVSTPSNRAGALDYFLTVTAEP